MTPIKITKASFKDLKDILFLQKLSFRSEADVYNDFETSPPLLQTLEEITNEFSEQIFLKAVLEDKIVGSIRGFEVDDTVFIKRLVVNPDYQNLGIGTILMNSIENSFRGNKRFELFTGHKSIKICIHIFE